jgi:hypothetical protein
VFLRQNIINRNDYVLGENKSFGTNSYVTDN